jgi:hypothetical protein
VKGEGWTLFFKGKKKRGERKGENHRETFLNQKKDQELDYCLQV